MSLTATVALASAITMLMHVALIWTLSGRGFNTVMTGVVIVFSRSDHSAAAVPGLAATVAVLAAVSRSRRRAVSHLQRQHRSARGAVRNRPANCLDGADHRRRLCADWRSASRASSCRADDVIDALSTLRTDDRRIDPRADAVPRVVPADVGRTLHHHRRRDARHLGAVRPVRQSVAVDAAASRVLLWRGEHQLRVHRRAGARLRSVRRAVHQDRQLRSRAVAAAQHGAAAGRPRVHVVSRRPSAAGRDRAGVGLSASGARMGRRRASRCSRSRCSRRSCSSTGWSFSAR